MKTMKAFVLTVFLLFATTVSANPQSGSSIPGSEDKSDVTIKKSASKDALHGLIFRLGLGSNHRLNLEPENAEWVSSYHFTLGYRLGKELFGKGFFKPLTVSANFSLSNELVGNDPRYRTAYFSDSSLYTSSMSSLALVDSVYTPKESDSTPRIVSGAMKRPDYSDVVINLSHPSIYTIPVAKIGISGSFSATVPTSLTSRNVGLKTKLDYSIGFSRSFKIGSMSLGLEYGFGFTQYFYDYETASINSNDDPVYVNGIAYDPLTYDGVSRNTEFAFTNMLGVSFSPIKKLSVNASYGLLTMRSYNFSNCEYTTPDGMIINVCDTTTAVRTYDDGGRGRRDYQMFSLGASYKLLDYLSLSLTLNTFTPQLKPSTEEYQQPFLSFDRNNYSSVMFKVSYSFDSFYNKVIAK
ncbi:MAG: hypothetical protein JXR95_01315 [Deltaproteobacteria bacterium]|nr:hypothetical protein [Deltaproteobacteria bacterium]